LVFIIRSTRRTLYEKLGFYYQEYKANLVRKTWFLLSGVQGEPCTKNLVFKLISQIVISKSNEFVKYSG